MNDSLGDRMKNYEQCYNIKLPENTNIIIRLDGKAFHSFTKKMERPFDDQFKEVMQLTTEALCKEIQGVSFAYTQSDEINLLLTDAFDPSTQPWFNNELQKMVSVSASACTSNFIEYNYEIFHKFRQAQFDSRVFFLPDFEITNYFIWRQNDATRNSLQMLTRTHFSAKECYKKNAEKMHNMLHSKGVNWNNYPIHHRRGAAFYKITNRKPLSGVVKKSAGKDFVERSVWYRDLEMPILTQDREYVEKWIGRRLEE